MDRIEFLLHMVGSEDVGGTGKPMKKSILGTKDWRRSDNSGLREDAARNLFPSSLGPEELG